MHTYRYNGVCTIQICPCVCVCVRTHNTNGTHCKEGEGRKYERGLDNSCESAESDSTRGLKDDNGGYGLWIGKE